MLLRLLSESECWPLSIVDDKLTLLLLGLGLLVSDMRLNGGSKSRLHSFIPGGGGGGDGPIKCGTS